MAHVFTDDNFQAEVLECDIPVLVDFYAAWCGPCQAMAPVVDELSKEYEGKIKIGKLDVEASQETAGKYGIMSIPAFKIFKAGKVVSEKMGAMSKADFVSWIESLL